MRGCQNLKKTDHSNTIPFESVKVGILLAIVGGFLDAYTFVGRGGVFANAQTGNIVLIGIEIYNRNFHKTLFAVAPVLACILGVIFVEIIKEKCPKKLAEESETVIIIVEIIIFFFIGFIPKSINDSIVNIIVAFVSSVQIASFRRLVDSPYSTTMCTGNLRTATQSAYIAITKKNEKAFEKSIRYFKIVGGFLIGGFLGAMMTSYFGVSSIWFASIVLIITVIVVKIDKRKHA